MHRSLPLIPIALGCHHPDPPKLIVFSGGTGFNSVACKLNQRTNHVAHVLPVSDNGGSSQEIRKALGGIAVGDIRSRLVRIAAEDTREALAVKELLQYRLPMQNTRQTSTPEDLSARMEWNAILEGRHTLWNRISVPYRDTIRSFLLHFHHAVLNRSPTFDFRNGSIGNFFFAGACIDLSSIEAAIFLVGSVLRIPQNAAVIPVVNTRSSLTLGAELADGSVVLGQTNISHPSEDRTLIVDKEVAGRSCLASRIVKVFYVNEDLQRIDPPVNPRVIDHLNHSDHVIYSMGSLYTSIVPTLILRGVAEAIQNNSKGRKVLILNGSLDRETQGMRAVDFVQAVCDGLNRYGELENPVQCYVTDVVALQGTEVEVQAAELEKMGIRVHFMAGGGRGLYDADELVEFLGKL